MRIPFALCRVQSTALHMLSAIVFSLLVQHIVNVSSPFFLALRGRSVHENEVGLPSSDTDTPPMYEVERDHRCSGLVP